MSVEGLSSFHRSIERIRSTWSVFSARRAERLRQQERFGSAAEKVAENILEDLFSEVLDWSIGEINNQVGYADLVLTRLGIKHLVVEVKRPGALAWNRGAVERALDQARRYADEQKVKTIAVSDGAMLYAADIEHGGLHDRVFADLSSAEPQESLWWLSVQGIYRPRVEPGEPHLVLLPHEATDLMRAAVVEGVLHPKYKIPAQCFGYVGNAADPHTWHLPYKLADGSIDGKRLPKAIQAILSNYRGVQVSSVPERDIPDVLVRLGIAAAQVGKMPHQTGHPSECYAQLAEALEQLGRLTELSG